MKQDQPAREANVQALVTFFESGIKDPATPGRLGVELEHTIVDKHMNPVSYGQDHGVAWILEELLSDFPEKTTSLHGDLIGVARDGSRITLEPGAQLELSAGPFENVGQVRLDFEEFERHLARVLAPQGYRALVVGYHPTAKAADIALIPKFRFKCMDEYFKKIGPWGQRMMRGSASTQISIDYYSEADCMRKMRLANALAPLFALMCDNAAVFEAAPRPHQMMRTAIWNGCDPDRSGTVPKVMDSSFSFRQYAEYVLDMPAILIPTEGGGWKADSRTFGEIYADKPMTPDHVEHAVSMPFPDVRLKTYLEIRPADSMPIPYATAYAALIKGLFYSNESLDCLDSMMGDVDAKDIEGGKATLMKQGYKGTLYGKSVAVIAEELLTLAQHALAQNERNYLSPLQHLVKNRTTLACLKENTYSSN